MTKPNDSHEQASLIGRIKELAPFIGSTPLKKLDNDRAALYAKLEYNNFTGSVKDRAAYSMIYHAICEGKINRGTTVVASSSGNLAIAAAMICRFTGIKFIPVIDPNINRDYEALLRLISMQVEKVGKRDVTGGFLLSRLERVKDICDKLPNSFVLDQYGDTNNYLGYYQLGDEILSDFEPDYVFAAVSSGGAITGLSRNIKKKRPWVSVIGVDVEGSVIFGQQPKTRHISGIGSSIIPPILKYALIDDVIHIAQADIISGCRELLGEQLIFGGASSGAVYLAAKRFMEMHSFSKKPIAVLIFADRGYSYLDTIYDKEWERLHFSASLMPEEADIHIESTKMMPPPF